MAIPPKKRFHVFERDGFKCKYCGMGADRTVLEVGHIVPKSKGGKDIEKNLITSCHACNRGKGDKILGEQEEGHKAKINRLSYNMKIYFYDEWNKNKMGMIDNKTKVLIKFFIESLVGGDSFEEHLCYPRFDTKYNLDSRTQDGYEQAYKFFLTSNEYQDDVIEIVEEECRTCIENAIKNVFDTDYWSWSCDEDYTGKLNYYITDFLVEDYIGEGRGYVLHKFTLYPKIINNAKKQND